jgi:hypothetical protein
MKKFTLIAGLLCAALLAGCGNYAGRWTASSASAGTANPAEMTTALTNPPTPGPYIGTFPTAPVIVFAGSEVVKNSTLPAQTAQLLAPQKFDYFNESLAGNSTGQMLEAASWAIDPFFRPTRTENILVVWAGQADLANGTAPGLVFDNLMAYCQARRAVGFKVVVVTLLPVNARPAQGSYEAERQTLNSRLRSQWPEFADALADVAALPAPASSANPPISEYSQANQEATESGWSAETIKTAIANLFFN